MTTLLSTLRFLLPLLALTLTCITCNIFAAHASTLPNVTFAPAFYASVFTTVAPDPTLPDATTTPCIAIGAAYSLSGEQSERGLACSQAIRVWTLFANARGGQTVNGTRYYFLYVWADDGSITAYSALLLSLYAASTAPLFDVLVAGVSASFLLAQANMLALPAPPSRQLLLLSPFGSNVAPYVNAAGTGPRYNYTVGNIELSTSSIPTLMRILAALAPRTVAFFSRSGFYEARVAVLDSLRALLPNTNTSSFRVVADVNITLVVSTATPNDYASLFLTALRNETESPDLLVLVSSQQSELEVAAQGLRLSQLTPRMALYPYPLDMPSAAFMSTVDGWTWFAIFDPTRDLVSTRPAAVFSTTSDYTRKFTTVYPTALMTARHYQYVASLETYIAAIASVSSLQTADVHAAARNMTGWSIFNWHQLDQRFFYNVNASKRIFQTRDGVSLPIDSAAQVQYPYRWVWARMQHGDPVDITFGGETIVLAVLLSVFGHWVALVLVEQLVHHRVRDERIYRTYVVLTAIAMGAGAIWPSGLCFTASISVNCPYCTADVTMRSSIITALLALAPSTALPLLGIALMTKEVGKSSQRAKQQQQQQQQQHLLAGGAGAMAGAMAGAAAAGVVATSGMPRFRATAMMRGQPATHGPPATPLDDTVRPMAGELGEHTSPPPHDGSATKARAALMQDRDSSNSTLSRMHFSSTSSGATTTLSGKAAVAAAAHDHRASGGSRSSDSHRHGDASTAATACARIELAYYRCLACLPRSWRRRLHKLPARARTFSRTLSRHASWQALVSGVLVALGIVLSRQVFVFSLLGNVEFEVDISMQVLSAIVCSVLSTLAIIVFFRMRYFRQVAVALLTTATLGDLLLTMGTAESTYDPIRLDEDLSDWQSISLSKTYITLIGSIVGGIIGIAFIALQFNRMKLSHHALQLTLEKMRRELDSARAAKSAEERRNVLATVLQREVVMSADMVQSLRLEPTTGDLAMETVVWAVFGQRKPAVQLAWFQSALQVLPELERLVRARNAQATAKGTLSSYYHRHGSAGASVVSVAAAAAAATTTTPLASLRKDNGEQQRTDVAEGGTSEAGGTVAKDTLLPTHDRRSSVDNASSPSHAPLSSPKQSPQRESNKDARGALQVVADGADATVLASDALPNGGATRTSSVVVDGVAAADELDPTLPTRGATGDVEAADDDADGRLNAIDPLAPCATVSQTLSTLLDELGHMSHPLAAVTLTSCASFLASLDSAHSREAHDLAFDLLQQFLQQRYQLSVHVNAPTVFVPASTVHGCAGTPTSVAAATLSTGDASASFSSPLVNHSTPTSAHSSPFDVGLALLRRDKQRIDTNVPPAFEPFGYRPTVQHILSHPVTYELLAAELERAHCVENALFLRHVARWRQITHRTLRTMIAATIMREFIVSGARDEINISAALRAHLVQQVAHALSSGGSNGILGVAAASAGGGLGIGSYGATASATAAVALPSTLFDAAEAEVIALVITNNWNAFKSTPSYAVCTLVLYRNAIVMTALLERMRGETAAAAEPIDLAKSVTATDVTAMRRPSDTMIPSRLHEPASYQNAQTAHAAAAAQQQRSEAGAGGGKSAGRTIVRSNTAGRIDTTLDVIDDDKEEGVELTGSSSFAASSQHQSRASMSVSARRSPLTMSPALVAQGGGALADASSTSVGAVNGSAASAHSEALPRSSLGTIVDGGANGAVPTAGATADTSGNLVRNLARGSVNGASRSTARPLAPSSRATVEVSASPSSAAAGVDHASVGAAAATTATATLRTQRA